LIKSNQLAGDGSVNIPYIITPGAKPYNSSVFDLWKMKSMSNNLRMAVGDVTKAVTPFAFLLLGTGMITG
jgi:hypothetical protein